MANWFNQVFGFNESTENNKQIKINTDLQTNCLYLQNNATNQIYQIGWWKLFNNTNVTQPNTLSNNVFYQFLKIKNIAHVHKHEPLATFQVASQLNALEFINQEQTPYDGITCYNYDFTQGPACAMAAPFATYWRNYYLNIPTQLNLLKKLEVLCPEPFWTVKNGYLLTSDEQLIKFNNWLITQNRDFLISSINVGLLEHTETIYGNYVNQVFCSAIPIPIYCNAQQLTLWQPLAQLILDAMYENTLWAAYYSSKSNQDVFLTLLGGGAFNNKPFWIAKAIARALHIVSNAGIQLNVYICYKKNISDIQTWIEQEIALMNLA